MKWLIGLSIVFVGCAMVWNAALTPVMVPAAVSIVVAPGERTDSIVNNLYEHQLIKNKLLFKTYVWTMYRGQTLKAGEYTFAGQLSLPTLVHQLIVGSGKQEVVLRIIEGWTNRQIAGYLLSQGIGTENTILTSLSHDWSSRFDFLTPGQSLEGFLFPDTYRVFRDAAPSDVIEKMLMQFNKKFPIGLREEARQKGLTLHEVVTLASILEREVRSDLDRARVADIFYRRMEKGMPLQADSTVNYVTGKNTPSVSGVDLAIDSPYNTYKHKGLPPTPISNPGLASLVASLHPEKNAYWFFLTPKDGTVIYSKTFEEHVRNKRRYLQ
ncbi:MAG: endolytic transglycosylase MltG [bacterium]|nr:endolytic transglycosylase MltG [bacterium]